MGGELTRSMIGLAGGFGKTVVGREFEGEGDRGVEADAMTDRNVNGLDLGLGADDRADGFALID